ncbi:MAG: DUF2066 domain-containing protein [Alphaproteobacteria bacterium]
MTRICCGLALISFGLVLSTPPTAHAQSRNIYAVTGIDVDRTSDTAAKARQEAIVDAHRRAFDRLMERLVPADQRADLPVPAHADIVPMVLSFGIDQEKTSRVRYIGSLSFQFRRAEVRRFLKAAGASFAETKSKPVLLLPVMDSGGAKLLWDDPNPWFAAWNAVPPSSGLVPLRLPVGDLADIRDISAEQAAAGSKTQIDMIGERYGAATVVIAEAVVDLVTVSGQRNVNLSLRYLGGPWSDQTGIRIFRIQEGETDAEALSRIALETSRQIEEDWKRDNILVLDSRDNLIADVELNELREWVEMRRRLRGIAFLQNTQLVTISRTQATVRLTYFGNPGQLRNALAQRDLVLERGSVNWILRDARAPVSPAGAVTEPAPAADTDPAVPASPVSGEETEPAPATGGAPR